MKYNVIGYFLSEGFRNVLKNKKSTISCIGVMCVTMLMFGLFFAIGRNITHMMNNIEDAQAIQVNAKDNITQEQVEKMKEDIKCLLLRNYRDSLVEMGKRSVYQFDNFYITPLEIANWESSNIEDKRTILKIDNTFKNILLLNDINEENSNNFIENNKDMFDCEAVMFYGNESSELKIMQYIKPKIIFTSNKQNYENSKFDIITKEDGEITKQVW